MHAQRRRFNLFCLGIIALAAMALPAAYAASAEAEPAFRKGNPSLYQDLFDQSAYYEGTNLLRFDRLYRKLFGKKLRSLDINAYDEVPDSGLFENRHARKALSAEELQSGVHETSGPDMSRDLTIYYVEAEETPPKFWVRDSKGDEYLLKFDPQDYLELSTAAEVITNRAYHALGYNVFQNTIASFPSEKLVLGQGADIYDSTGFKKKLTKEKLQELVLFIPADAEGRLRASAIKVPKGEALGGWGFTNRLSKSSSDFVNASKHRSIRALQVFGSWLNNDDMRQSTSISLSGEKGLTYYLTDFDSALGAGNQGPKPPMLGYEHMVDFGQTTKAILTFGLWEKPWQKNWRESGEKIHSNAVGYFSNAHFDPAKFKTQLPYYAFKDVTSADGLWAAKILMTLSDDDIRALVKSGQYSDPNDEKYIADTLIERRNLVAGYWFKHSSALDEFDLKGDKLVFKDLAAQYGFAAEGKSVYRAEVFAKRGSSTRKTASFESYEPAITIERGWFEGDESVGILIRVLRPGEAKPSPCVWVDLNTKGVAGISHQD